MTDLISWKIVQHDGKVISENDGAKYTDIDSNSVKSLFFIQQDSNVLNEMEISVPHGAKIFFRKRRHVKMISGNIKKIEYIGGYRQLIGDSIQTVALIITVQKNMIVGVRLNPQVDIEFIDREKFNFER